MSLIACENVSIGYGSKIIAENLNFTVEKGDFLCIIGENGVGKSTLIKTLLNLQKPLRGTIKFNISAGEIGFLAQETQISSDFPASVAEIVISGRLTPKKFFYNADDEKIAAHNMNLLKILPLKRKSFRELSGGQQKRVLLARALCSASKILILDEPTANLDPNSAENFYKIVSELNLSLGLTIIMISHDLNASISHATHILRLGNEFFFGKRENFANV